MNTLNLASLAELKKLVSAYVAAANLEESDEVDTEEAMQLAYLDLCSAFGLDAVEAQEKDQVQALLGAGGKVTGVQIDGLKLIPTE